MSIGTLITQEGNMNVVDVTHLVWNSPIPLLTGTRAILIVDYKGRECDLSLVLMNEKFILYAGMATTVDTSDSEVFGGCNSTDDYVNGLEFVKCIRSLSVAARGYRGTPDAGVYALAQFNSASFLHYSLPLWIAKPGAPHISHIREVLGLTGAHMSLLYAMLPSPVYAN